MSSRRYVCCICRPQRVGDRPTGPSVPLLARNATDAALKMLAYAEWAEPGYIEVIVYMSPEEDHPQAGKRWRLRIHLEPDR